jgi:hypothetical protein
MSDTIFGKMMAELGLDRSGYSRGLKEARTEATGFSKFLGSVLTGVGLGGGIGAGVQAFQALGQMMGYAKDKAIGMNATLETTILQFATLMGSTEKAEAHVKSLYTFANRTPFEADPIIEASRYMQTFGGATLNSERHLTLFGDAAAGTKQPINEVSFWLSRLYSNLKGGQPFGEAAMRLQELAVMSPEARAQMEALQKQGKSLDEIWAIMILDLERFNGSMARQSNTWQGLTSSISDSMGILTARGLKPFFEGGKEILRVLAEMAASPAAEQFADNVAAGLSRGLQSATDTAFGWAEAFLSMDQQTATSIGRILGFMDGLATYAYTWGQQVVGLFAQGIITMLGEVAWAVNEIGNMIGYWMEPQSPPRFLPNIDKWGKDTALQWLGGWKDAPLTDLKGFLAGIDAQLQQAKGELASVQGQLGSGRDFAGLGANQRLLRLRQELKRQDLTPERRKQLELQLRELTLQSRINRLTTDRAAIERRMQQETQTKMVKAMKGMEESANRIAKALEKALSPEERSLKIAQMQQAELQNLIRLKQLQAVLDDENATQAQKTAAMLEMQAIQAERAIRAQQAAELGVDLSWLQDIPIVLEDIDKGAGKAGKGVGGLGTALSGLQTMDLSGLGEGMGEPLLNLEERLAGLKEKYATFNETVTKGADEGRLAWTNFVTTFEEEAKPLMDTIQKIEDALNGTQAALSRVAKGIRGEYAPMLQKTSDETANWFQQQSDEAAAWLQAKSDANAQWFQDRADEFGYWTLGIMGSWTLSIDTFSRNVFGLTAEALRRTFNTIISYLNTAITNANAALGTSIPTVAPIGGAVEQGMTQGGTVPKAATVESKGMTTVSNSNRGGDTHITIIAPSGNAKAIRREQENYLRTRRAMGY